MGFNLLSLDESPSFESNVEVLSREADWIKFQSCDLSSALRSYGEALDPRLRRAPALGLGSSLANYTAPFLEALGKQDEGFGSPWDNVDKRLADVLEAMCNPDQDDDDEMALPLSVAVGAPLLQPVADVLRSLGALREQLSLKTLDCVSTKLDKFISDELDTAQSSLDQYQRRRQACENARAQFLTLPRWAGERERDERRDLLEDAKHAAEAARARLILALCDVDGKRRYALIETVHQVMQEMATFFERAAQQMSTLKPLMEHMKEYEDQAREQATQKMAAQAAHLNQYWDRAKDIDEKIAAKLSGDGEEKERQGKEALKSAKEERVEGLEDLAETGCSGAGAAAAEDVIQVEKAHCRSAPGLGGRSQDEAIRETLSRGKQADSVLGQAVIRQGYLLQWKGGRRERGFFVLDNRGTLAQHSGPADATAMLRSNSNTQVQDHQAPAGMHSHHIEGDAGLLLPIAQGAMHHAGGAARSAWSFFMGKGTQKVGEALDRQERVDLMVSTIKLDADESHSAASHLPFCFRIISPTTRLTLQAESEEDRQAWVLALQGVTAELLHANIHSSASNKSSPCKQLKSTLGSSHCAECGEDSPDWAVINRGVLICQLCAGAHRHLGAHLSKVRHVTLDADAWTPAIVQLFELSGNELGNSALQGGVKDLAKAAWEFVLGASGEGTDDIVHVKSDTTKNMYVIQKGMTLEQRTVVIRGKYVDRRFMDPDLIQRASEPGSLVDAAKQCSIKEVLKLMAAGADVNLFDSGGETPLHAACAQGEDGLVVVQALLLNGANATLFDEWGLTPLEVAQVSGAPEDGELMNILNRSLKQSSSTQNLVQKQPPLLDPAPSDDLEGWDDFNELVGDMIENDDLEKVEETIQEEHKNQLAPSTSLIINETSMLESAEKLLIEKTSEPLNQVKIGSLDVLQTTEVGKVNGNEEQLEVAIPNSSVNDSVYNIHNHNNSVNLGNVFVDSKIDESLVPDIFLSGFEEKSLAMKKLVPKEKITKQKKEMLSS